MKCVLVHELTTSSNVEVNIIADILSGEGTEWCVYVLGICHHMII